MNKPIFAAILFLFIICTVCTGCSPIPKTEIEFVIGVSLSDLQNPWDICVYNRIQSISNHYDSIRFIIVDAAGSDSKQINDIKRCINFDVDAMLICPNNYAVLKPKLKQICNDLKIVILDKVEHPQDFDAVMWTDTIKLGEKTADITIANLKNNNANILELIPDNEELYNILISKYYKEYLFRHTSDILVTTKYIDISYNSDADHIIDSFLSSKHYDIVFTHSEQLAKKVKKLSPDTFVVSSVMDPTKIYIADSSVLLDTGVDNALDYLLNELDV